MNAIPWVLTVLFAALWWRAQRTKPDRTSPPAPLASPAPPPQTAALQGAPLQPSPADESPHHSAQPTADRKTDSDQGIEAADPSDERLMPRRRWVWAGAGLLAVGSAVVVLSSAYNGVTVVPQPQSQSMERISEAPAERLVLGGADPARAPALLRSYGCGACHVVPGVAGAAGRVGPNLAHLHDHALIAGVLPNTPENLVLWIRVPQNIDPYTGMPNLGVTERDARDLAAFLQALP